VHSVRMKEPDASDMLIYGGDRGDAMRRVNGVKVDGGCGSAARSDRTKGRTCEWMDDVRSNIDLQHSGCFQISLHPPNLGIQFLISIAQASVGYHVPINGMSI